MAKQPRKKRSFGRRILTLLVLALFCAGFFQWSNRSLQVERFTFTSSRLPQGFDGCTIVVLADLHGAVFGKDNQRLLDTVSDQAPDMILLAGDLLDRIRETPHSYAVDLGRRLSAIAPTYFVTGNHEWALPDVPELKDGLEAAGVTVLDNRFVTLDRGGDQILLAGVDDPNGYADQKTPEELAQEVRAAWGDGFWLLLAHRNNYFDRYAACGYALVLSGHAHGGLVRLPFTDGVFGSGGDLFPTWTAGVYTLGESTLYATRGLGNNTTPIPGFRIFNRPEISVLELTKK